MNMVLGTCGGPPPPHSVRPEGAVSVDETYSQGNGSVGHEAGLQRVHQVHIIAHHFDSDVLPAQLLGPLGRAVTAVNDQVGAVPVAQAGAPQPHHHAQPTQHPHGGGRRLSFFKHALPSSQLVGQLGTISHRLPWGSSAGCARAAVRISCPAAHLPPPTFCATCEAEPGSRVGPGRCEPLRLCHSLLMWSPPALHSVWENFQRRALLSKSG